MKTRTPVPPPRKRRKSLINLCTKRNDSVEYVNLCACENEYCDRNIFDSKNFSENKLYSSEPDLFKKFSNAGTEQQHSNLRRSVSYEEVASLREFCRVIKTSSDNTSTRILNSYIHRCLLCYINDIMSLVEQINTTNNDEYKFKLDDTSSYDNDEYNEKEIQLREDENEREEEQQDGTVLDKETKLCEINEQKLLESLENFCIHCYLNKIQTHPKEREDISSTSTKVNENNLKSFQTGDNNNFSLANKNVGNKISLMGNTHDKNHFPPNSTAKETEDRGRACTNSMKTQTFSQPQNSCLDKKYDCLFCCINKSKTKQKHYNNGSLYEIYSKKTQNNVFKSDNTNEQECKYTIGNKVGDKRENKIRNEKLCEINNAQNKNTHSNNMLEHFKNLNCCRRRHLNLFKYMCFQCFYVYVQILYVLQNSALFSEDFTSNIFKMRKCEVMRSLSIKNIQMIVNVVQQIHSCFSNSSIESNICKSCAQVLFPDDKYQLQLSSVNKNKIENKNSKNHSRKNERNNVQSAKNPQKESKTAAIPRENVNYTLQENQRRTDEDFKRYNTNRKMLQNLRKNIDSHRKKRPDERLHDRNKQNNSQSSIPRKVQVGNVVNNTGQDRHHKQTDVVDNLSTGKTKISQESINEVDSQSLERKMNAKSDNQTTCNKILKNFNNVHDPSIAERRKNKFQELMANLNSKKISCDTEAANKDKPLPKVQEHSNNNIVNNNKQEPNCENQLLFDNNGNYLDNSETSKQKSSQISLGNQIDNLTAAVEESKLSTAVNQDLTYVTPNQINDKRGFIIRNSMKRKSYKLKRNHENQPGDLESRRSSVTDSLYELEASLYEMLQNSCSLSMEDVEYV